LHQVLFKRQMFRQISNRTIQGALKRNLFTTSRIMAEENQYGQGASHATGHSKVPEAIQKVAPRKLEEALPDSVCLPDRVLHLLVSNINDQIHPTGSDPGQSVNKSHAKGGGEESVVPQKVQEKLPEGVERAVPNTLHDTGDESGLHRK
jgi:hypothetical protein